jgi:glycosyltransferase involved in cell wall biosynthesis
MSVSLSGARTEARKVAKTAAVRAKTEPATNFSAVPVPLEGSTGAPSQVTTKLVSVIIPIYNEHQYVERILERVQAAPLPEGLQREIIVVDDGSTDGTTIILGNLHESLPLKVHHSVLNFGKGTAIRIGLHYATGDFILVQDGDLEYDPSEYGKLLEPLIRGEADVVYGSRFKGKLAGMRWQNFLANKILTGLSNLLYGAEITDEATGYKAFRKGVLQQVRLQCKRFEFCPEVTAKLRKKGFRIAEVPITYEGRTAQQGKKIKFSDGLQAVWTLLRYRFTD